MSAGDSRDAAEVLKPSGKPLFYQAKQVPSHLQDFIFACQQGNLEAVRVLWEPLWLREFSQLKREDTCHPLLTATHHLRPAVVEFLCEQGLSPFRPGTVHPYTGDGMVVTELQGISPIALVEKMSFLHPRRSKRRVLIDEVREVLQRAVGNSGGGPPFTPVATTPSPTLEGAEAHPPEGDDEREFDVPVPPANKPLPQREDAPSPSSSGSEEEDTDDEEDEEEEAGPTCTPSSQRKGVSFSTPVTMGKRQEGYRGEATPATSAGPASAPLKKRKVVSIVPQPKPTVQSLAYPYPMRTSPGRSTGSGRKSVPAHAAGDESGEECATLPAGKATTVLAFLNSPVQEVTTIPSFSLGPLDPSILPPGTPIPNGAVTATVSCPSSLSVPLLLLRALHAVCGARHPTDLSDILACVETCEPCASALAEEVESEAGSEVDFRSPPRLPRSQSSSWSVAMPQAAASVTASRGKTSPGLTIRHAHVSAPVGTQSALSPLPSLSAVNLDALLRPGTGVDDESSSVYPCTFAFLSYAAGEDSGGFLLYVRGNIVAHRWAYQLCSCGFVPLASAGQYAIPCQPFLSWERATALHVDQALAAGGSASSSKLAPLLPYGTSRPHGSSLHVCRPPSVRFLSLFDEGADADFESLAGVSNAARTTSGRGLPHPVYERVVVWVDARNIGLMKKKSVKGFVSRHLAVVSASSSFAPGCTVLVVVRIVGGATVGEEVSSSLHGVKFTSGTGVGLSFALVGGSLASVPYWAGRAGEEATFTFRLALA